MNVTQRSQLRRAELLEMSGSFRTKQRLQESGQLPSDQELRLLQAELDAERQHDVTLSGPGAEAQFARGDRPLSIPDKQHQLRLLALTIASSINQDVCTTLPAQQTDEQRLSELEGRAKRLRALFATAEAQLQSLGL